MRNNIVIPRPGELEEKITAIQKGGADQLHVIADFDRTLTKAYVNGKKVSSLIAILRDEHFLTPDYPEKAQALFDHYHPIELDPTIPLNEKKSVMHEWWRKHFQLMIASGLQKNDLEQLSKSKSLQLRDGATAFLALLHARNIPLVIFSSSGVGDEPIVMMLEREHQMYSNIHIVGNLFIWDTSGRAMSVREPIIHVMNKDETSMRNYPFYETIQNRKNVLLLGDSLGDVGMASGLEHRVCLRVGFLNDNIDRDLPYYKEAYDVVILYDGSMEWVVKMLETNLGNF